MVYFVIDPDWNFSDGSVAGRVKIGTTIRLSARLAQLKRWYGDNLKVIGVLDGSFADETVLHNKFKHLRDEGEWFRIGDDLMAFVDQEARPWDGTDEIPDNDVLVKVDAEVVRKARIAASYKDVSLAEYLSEALRPIIARDIEEEHAKLKRSEPAPAEEQETEKVRRTKGTKP